MFWKQEVAQLRVSFFKSEMRIVHLKATRTHFTDIICIFAVSEEVAEGMKHKTATVQLSRMQEGNLQLLNNGQERFPFQLFQSCKVQGAVLAQHKNRAGRVS